MRLNMNKKNKQSLMESGVGGGGDMQGQRWGNSGRGLNRKQDRRERRRGRNCGNKGGEQDGSLGVNSFSG